MARVREMLHLSFETTALPTPLRNAGVMTCACLKMVCFYFGWKTSFSECARQKVFRRRLKKISPHRFPRPCLP